MIPGDVRIVAAKDLFVTQGSLTGESFPVEKFEVEKSAATTAPHRADQHRVPRHQRRERLGDGGRRRDRARTPIWAAWPSRSREQPTPTAFDQGISRFTWLMLRFMLVMVPLVFVINGLTKGNWARGLLLRAGRGRGPDARDAADDRDGLPVQGRHGDEPQEGDRQAAQLHPEPRRDGRALHRQDRHADDGPRHPGAALRRGAAARTTACSRWPTSTATSRPA